jgi:hypothetical protein
MLEDRIKFNFYYKSIFVLLALGIMGLISGCATNIKATTTMNNPPTEKLSNFENLQIERVYMPPEIAEDSANRRALVKIQENIDKNINGTIYEWNSRGNPAGRKLVIKPVIEEMKFVSSGTRVFFGPMAGSSAVRMKLLLIDDSTKQVIGEPEFYQRAEAWAGAFTIGVHDNLMMTRIASLISDYIHNNYSQAIGGPTGADESLVAPQGSTQ